MLVQEMGPLTVRLSRAVAHVFALAVGLQAVRPWHREHF